MAFFSDTRYSALGSGGGSAGTRPLYIGIFQVCAFQSCTFRSQPLKRWLLMLLTVCALLGWVAPHAAATDTENVAGRTQAQAALTRLVDQLNEQRLLVFSAAHGNDRDQALRAITDSQRFDIAIDHHWIDFMAAQPAGEEHRQANRFHEALVAYRWERDTALRLSSTYYYTRAREHIDSHATPSYQHARDQLLALVELYAHGHAAELTPVRASINPFKEHSVLITALIVLALASLAAMPLIRSRRTVGAHSVGELGVLPQLFTHRVSSHNTTDTPEHKVPTHPVRAHSVRESIATPNSITHQTLRTLAQRLGAGLARLAGRNHKQLQSLNDIAARMTEVNQSLHDSVNQTREASQIVNQARELGEHGSEHNRQAMAKMDELGSSSERISGIISMIDEIAFQTNILALNASVEAARAGEQGRGFAVVASEVRSLAQRSADAAREIQILINQNSNIVKVSGGLVTESGQAMDNLLGNVRQVSELLAEMTASSRQQSETLEHIVTAIDRNQRGTHKNGDLLADIRQDAELLEEQL